MEVKVVIIHKGGPEIHQGPGAAPHHYSQLDPDVSGYGGSASLAFADGYRPSTIAC
jgi:hypothetical protein